MDLLGEDAGFRLGDATVAVGVAAADGIVEDDVGAEDGLLFVIEDDGEGDAAFALLAMGGIGQSTHRLVKGPGGEITFKLHGETFFVAHDGFLGVNTSGGEARGQDEGGKEAEVHGCDGCQGAWTGATPSGRGLVSGCGW